MNSKFASYGFIISAVLFDIVAIMKFLNNDTEIGICYLAIGSAMLCIGSVQKKKDKK